MPQVLIEDTVRVAVRLLRGDEQIVNVWHVQGTPDPPTPTDMADLIAAFNTFYVGISTNGDGGRGIRNFIDAQVFISTITAQYIGQLPYGDPVESFVNLAGTSVGDVLPLQTALCVQLRTGIASRRGRGRVFLGGFGEFGNDDTDGYPRPSTALMTAVTNALTDLFDNVRAVDTFTDVGVASKLDGICRAVTVARVSNTWSTQRRRAISVPRTATQIATNS